MSHIIWLPRTPQGLAYLREALAEARDTPEEDRLATVEGYDWDGAARLGKRADHELQEYFKRRYAAERGWRTRRARAQQIPDPQGAA